MGELYVEAIGDGPPLLMMHGGLGLDHSYLRAHDALADTYRITYYDHRWNGRSARTGDATLAQWHADAAFLIDERAIVYGHSYGAWLALGFALAYPHKVERLVLCGASPQLDYADEVIALAMQRDPALAGQLVAGLTTPPADDAALARLFRTILPLYFKGRVPDGFLDGTVFSAQGYAAGNAELATLATEHRLTELAMPTLILEGAWDFITPPKHAQRLRAIAGATYEEFAESGHFPFVEEPDRYLAVLRRWLLT